MVSRWQPYRTTHFATDRQIFICHSERAGVFVEIPRRQSLPTMTLCRAILFLMFAAEIVR